MKADLPYRVYLNELNLFSKIIEMLGFLTRRDFVTRALTAVLAVTPVVAAASFRNIQSVGISAAVPPGAPSAVVGRYTVFIQIFFAHRGIRSRSHNQIIGFRFSDDRCQHTDDREQITEVREGV